ncbi:MAG TPA: hypothetical protein VMT22_09240 [Terriglobales bacterium]|nr:hypothetical protein [Terriglobales bacterium]
MSLNRWSLFFLASAIGLTACSPMEQVRRPTLREVRLGSVQGRAAQDVPLRSGEIAGEVTGIDPSRQEIQVLVDDGRRQVLTYAFNRTRVMYHGLDYNVDNLEAGDRIAFDSRAHDGSFVDTIHILEPVQARSGPRVATPAPARPRTEVVEGTVESVDVNRGFFDLRPRAGSTVTVSVPYNARAADIDSFRSLRRGDSVRVEGEFVSRDSFQLLSFLSPRGR